MKCHTVTRQIIDQLNTHHMWFELFEHAPVRTSEEAANIRNGYTLQQGAKALIIKIKTADAQQKYIMLVTPGDQRFNNRTVKHLLGAKDLRFASEEEVISLTKGVLPGGVPPFGNLFNMEVLVDPSLLENEKIIFNAGDRSISVGMHTHDYLEIVQPRIETII